MGNTLSPDSFQSTYQSKPYFDPIARVYYPPHPDKEIQIPRITLKQLLQELSNSQNNAQPHTSTLLELVIARGYVVISMYDDRDSETIPEEYQQLEEKLKRFYKAGDEFFSQPQTIKEKHQDPRNENKGYVMIEGLREYIKFRRIDQQTIENPQFVPSIQTDKPVERDHDPASPTTTPPRDPLVLWPSHPQDFTRAFNDVFDALLELSWVCFMCLYNQINHTHTPQDKALLKDLRQCIEEKGSISVIHYFPPVTSTPDEACENDPKLQRLDRVQKVYPAPQSADESLNVKVVCSTHQDTGLLTFIVCSEVPGLQIFDKQHRVWISVERLARSSKDVIMMIGQKGPLFINAPLLEATPHRVFLKNGIHRTSMAFLFDIAK